MRVLRRTGLVLLAALALAGLAAAAPPQSQLAAETNYTKALRPERGIRFVVIHVSEGSFLGTISWLQDPKAHASANFVVGRKGQVKELVPLHDIAWHAGNWAYNVRSVGIENEGFTGDPAGFTNAQYRSTARLAAVIARRALIPIDRRHIIGHSQVPDPNDPLQGGGIDGHTDPGKYWHWNTFMKLVERFAYPAKYFKEHHVGLQIRSSTIYNGQVVAGGVPWRTKVSGPVKRVSFVVDGKERWTDHVGPFAYAGGRQLDTFNLRNGKHVLELRAYGTKSWTRHRFTVHVKNEPFTLATVGLKAKQSVFGVQPVQALFTGVPPSRVLLYLDGREIDHDTAAPYVFRWDTQRVKDGLHRLTLAGRARDGRVVKTSISVRVVNGLVQPAAIASSSIADGQTVSGLQHWLVDASGSVQKVEFFVDGSLRATSTKAPYAYDWDSSAEAPGPHALLVRVTGLDGGLVEQSATATVSPPAAG
jgi:N-acetyl-anhydromuramyl-L-alanine amidase AmpD